MQISIITPKIPQLLKPPHKQSSQYKQIQEEIRQSIREKTVKPIEEPKQEFIVIQDLDENDFAQLIPLKQEPQKPLKQEQYKPKDYLEEFFDQKGIVQRQIDRKKKMINAIDYELEKNEYFVDKLRDDFQDYEKQLINVKKQVNMIENDAHNLTLLQKLEILQGNLDEALNLEIKEEFKLNFDDSKIDEKLEIMYQDTHNLIENYDSIKQQILYDVNKREEDEIELQELEQLDEKQQEDRKLELELRRRIELVKNEGIKLEMERKLASLQDSTLQRTEMKKNQIKTYSKTKANQTKLVQKKKQEFKEKPYNMQKQQFGYGKDKITFKPI